MSDVVLEPATQELAEAAAQASAKIVKGSTLKVYPGAPHVIIDNQKQQLNNDLLDFVKSWRSPSSLDCAE